MGDRNILRRFGSGLMNLGLPRGSILAIAAWPAICAIVGLILWSQILQRIDEDRRAAETRAMQDAASLAHGYAQYLANAIEQIDQITLQIKYQWAQRRGRIDLAALSESGIFRSAHIVTVVIIDRHGDSLTHTLLGSQQGARISARDRDYFAFHSNDASDVLLIGKPTLGRLTGKTAIQFTRRLSAADGSFDGVVLVAVEPDYLTAYFAGPYPGMSGMLAVVGNDGALRSARIGDASQGSGTPVFRNIPLFDSPSGATLLQEASWFVDQQPRFVGWETLSAFPLVAMVGLSEEIVLAPHRETAARYQQEGTAASILLLLFALAAMAQSARLASKRQQAEEVRKAYRIATEGGNEGFYMLKALRDNNDDIIDFQVEDCNERGAANYGLAKEEMLGQKLSALYAATTYFYELMNTYTEAMKTGFHEDEKKMPHDGPVKIAWAKRRLVRSGTGLAVTIEDISERKLTEEKMEFLAHHDPLTGLPNRLLLRDRFDQAMASATREETGVALLFLDLDNFKQVNDSFGHKIGDDLLVEVVRRLHRCIRDTDTVSRQGGDEFIIILSNLNDVNTISRIAQNILDAVAEPVTIEGHVFGTSASIGICLFPSDGDDFDTLLKHADTAMYQTKASGRNGYHFFTEKMNIAALENLQLQTELRNALKQDELRLHFQPQIDILSGAVNGMEALIRWQHPERGLISPGRFIPLAEESGLIIPIGEWVLTEACRQARLWMDSGLPPFDVAVNLSALQFKRGNILETVKKALDASGLPPGLLELELTESILLQDMDSALATIRELKALGVSLSIDDFGTGYSSLSYLKRLKVDKLKIDQSFVRDIVVDIDDLAIVCAIIQLGKTMQLRVIAEGVETTEQLHSLKINGCHAAQGYYIGRPAPADEITRWLAAKMVAA